MTTQSDLKPSGDFVKSSPQTRSKRIPVGLRPEMHELLKEIAKKNSRSIVAQVERWIQNASETDTSML